MHEYRCDPRRCFGIIHLTFNIFDPITATSSRSRQQISIRGGTLGLIAEHPAPRTLLGTRARCGPPSASRLRRCPPSSHSRQYFPAAAAARETVLRCIRSAETRARSWISGICRRHRGGRCNGGGVRKVWIKGRCATEMTPGPSTHANARTPNGITASVFHPRTTPQDCVAVLR